MSKRSVFLREHSASFQAAIVSEGEDRSKARGHRRADDDEDIDNDEDEDKDHEVHKVEKEQPKQLKSPKGSASTSQAYHVPSHVLDGHLQAWRVLHKL